MTKKYAGGEFHQVHHVTVEDMAYLANKDEQIVAFVVHPMPNAKGQHEHGAFLTYLQGRVEAIDICCPQTTTVYIRADFNDPTWYAGSSMKIGSVTSKNVPAPSID